MEPLDLTKLKVYPLAQRKSMAKLEEILIEPAERPGRCPGPVMALVKECVGKVRAALSRGSSVMVIYGAHLIKNGGQMLLNRLMDHGWITHVATNGAGTIHDWEFSFCGKSTESVRENVATGTFGTWDETGRYINLALLVGGTRGEGYGKSLGRFIQEDGCFIPGAQELGNLLRKEPAHPLAAARADLLQAIRVHQLPRGQQMVIHHRRNASVLAQAFRQEVPMTVHPGIGYDIITNHPMFNGAAIGRAAAIDFRLFSSSVEKLDDGVVLSIGSAIMSPQIFEKSLSCVNNLRLQAGRPVVKGHTIYVVDLQDGGNWDWALGEPPKDNPAYYLRFCKSFSRMGGTMQYVQCDNILFLHNLYHELSELG